MILSLNIISEQLGIRSLPILAASYLNVRQLRVSGPRRKELHLVMSCILHTYLQMLHESIYWYQLIEYKVFFKFAFEFHNFIFEKRNLNSLPVEGLFNNMKMVINLLLYLCNNHQILRHENVRYVYTL